MDAYIPLMLVLMTLTLTMLVTNSYFLYKIYWQTQPEQPPAAGFLVPINRMDQMIPLRPPIPFFRHHQKQRQNH